MSKFAEMVQRLSTESNGFEALKANLTEELVEQACAAMMVNANGQTRRRRLPPETVTFLLIGAALFRNESIQQVAKTMSICLGTVPSSSSISDARKRLGAESLRWLFRRLGQGWAADAPGYKWRALKTYGMDGTVITIPDSKANVAAFNKPGSRKDKSPASYPQARSVGLMELTSKMAIDAEIGPLSKGENKAAKDLISRIPSDSLTILDRGFQSKYNFFALFRQEQNRHFLCRIRNTFKARWVRSLSACSWIGRISFSKKEQAADPSLPEQIDVRVIEYSVEGSTGTIKIATSLLDDVAHPSADLAQLYHTRWEYELGLRDLKSTLMQSKDTIRSKTPEGVRQEIWATLLAYNLVRREMAVVAMEHEVSSARIRFKTAMVSVLNFFQVFSSGFADMTKLEEALNDLRAWLWRRKLPVRNPDRLCPRWVKRKQPSKFPKKPTSASGV